jgi:hypothetical protein
MKHCMIHITADRQIKSAYTHTQERDCLHRRVCNSKFTHFHERTAQREERQGDTKWPKFGRIIQKRPNFRPDKKFSVHFFTEFLALQPKLPTTEYLVRSLAKTHLKTLAPPVTAFSRASIRVRTACLFRRRLASRLLRTSLTASLSTASPPTELCLIDGLVLPPAGRSWPLAGRSWPPAGQTSPPVGWAWPLAGRSWPPVGLAWPPPDVGDCWSPFQSPGPHCGRIRP